MLYSYDELIKKYGTRYHIQKELKEKRLFKLEHGIYSDKQVVDPLALYSKKYPYAIVTMDSAFSYYDLTDVISNKVYLATPRNYRAIKNDEVIQLFIPNNILDIGKTTVTINHQNVSIYDKERLLVELIRKRKQIPFDYYKEVISNYREIVDELDMQKIEKYLSLFKNELNLAEALQREVF